MKETISVVLLCGGESRRMGEDKGNLMWEGETFVSRIAHALMDTNGEKELQARELILSVCDEASAGKFGYPARARYVSDGRTGCGPLAGMEASFRACGSELIFVTACDMPFVDRVLVRELCEKMRESAGADAVIPVDVDGRTHGVCGLYRRRVLRTLEQQLKAGDYRVRAWLGQIKTAYIDVSALTEGAHKLQNINTRKDFVHRMEHKNIHGIPVCSFVAYSGTGKTTFLERLIPELKQMGVKVAVVKHDGHDFDMDREGKDSWRLTQAGADVTGLISSNKAVLMENRHMEPEDLLDKIDGVDLILTEGMKKGGWPKIMLHRQAVNKPLPADPKACLAAVSDVPIEGAKALFAFEDVRGVAEFLVRSLGVGAR